MSTNAHGKDFWIGQIWIPRGNADLWRHVIIADIKPPKAKCHNLIISEDGESLKMRTRGSMISLKTLATRWTNCRVATCFCKKGS